MSYNGYVNYATWNVMLWLNNDYGFYHHMLDLLDELDEIVTADDAERIASQVMGRSTPDLENRPDMSWDDVAWDEIAEHMEEDRQG